MYLAEKVKILIKKFKQNVLNQTKMDKMHQCAESKSWNFARIFLMI